MKIAAIAVAVVLGTLGLNGLRVIGPNGSTASILGGEKKAQTATPLDLDLADSGIVRVTGRVQPRAKAIINSSLSLRIAELPFQEGDRVCKRGNPSSTLNPASVVARLDDSCLKTTLRAAEAKRDAQAAEIDAAKVRLTALESQIASSQVCLGEAERNWARYKQLVNTDVVSQTESDGVHCKYDRIRAEHDSAVRGYAASKATLNVLEKNLKAAEAELERARLDLGHAIITSPIDGIVTRVNVNVGEVVNGTITNPGTILMEVADLDHLLLVARVDEESIGKLKPGQKAIVHLKGCGDRAFSGAVQKVAPACTEDKDGAPYFKAEISLDTQGQRVPAGLTGEASIECSAANH